MNDGSFKTFLVVNPKAAAGGTSRRWRHIARDVKAAVGEFDHAFTEGPGHATVLAREALERGFEMVVAVGGDGTFNETVNGFFEGDRPIRPDAVFGIIPQGTGGDLRRTIGIETDYHAAVARLRGRQTRTFDVGHLRFVSHAGAETERVFINIADFGIGGKVVDEVNRATKVLGGKASFMIGSLKSLVRYRDQKVTVRFDGGPAETFWITNLAVCNGRFYGGGMQAAPYAAMDDGLFDVTIWSGLRLRDFVLNQKMIYDGTHLQDPRTRTLRCERVEATSDEEVLIDVDGEQPGRLPATFRILPGALTFKT